MSQHPNARLTPRGRETLVSRIGSGAGVVDGQPHELRLGVLGQELAEHVRRRMERDAETLDEAPLPLSIRMLEQMRRRDDALLVGNTLVEGGLDVVDEVVVDVIHAQVDKLRLERRLDLVLGDEVEGGELRGDGERVARMALDNGLVGTYLAVNVASTLPDPTADESPDTSAIFPMRV